MTTAKKRLTFDVADDRDGFCANKLYTFSMQEKTNFPDSNFILASHLYHQYYELKPIIYSADESLRSLSPKQ